MSREYVFSPSAAADLRAIAAYARDAAGAEIAEAVVIRIRDKCRILARTPGEIGVARGELVTGVRSFVVSPHVLFFRYTRTSVEIVRVLHERQDVDVASSADED